jgi:hypothetical protein
VRPGTLATVVALLLAVGCRSQAERAAAELAGLRRDASAGVEAIEAFCTARDSAIARAERSEPGAELVLEEVLLAPVVLDDYCEEFRYHEHDEADPDAHGDADSTAADTAGRGVGS